MALRSKKGRAYSSITPELLKDRRVQLLVGWFLQGKIETLHPALDQENGIRYLAARAARTRILRIKANQRKIRS